MNNLFKILDEKQYILADGATGTNLFAMGLETGNPPEPWNIDHKGRIRLLHQGFVDAGSDLILTNSFGGNSFRLKLHNLESQVFELNQTAAMIAREVADEAGRTVVVAGAIGPTGEMIEPHGLMTAKQATDAFKIQAEGLVEGGVDVLWLETMYSIEELEAAIEAVKEFDIPVCATMSFDTAGKTMMGVTPAELAKRSQGFGLFGVGGNCGVGAPDLLAAIIDINRNITDDTIIIAKANCGIPEFHDGSIVYSGTEELMAEYVHLALNSGARIVGGCCGTSFEHIRAMRKAMDKHKMKDLPDLQEIEENVGQLSAGSKAILTGQSATVKKQRRSRRSR
ncbi:MAG: betaine--homocysteine S-methyltransferase [Gammaproteobacteria bacterium]|jgi:5-methyltetrahydrofolate--homocysteine methyltransferase|nr:betaine--homocysteine S-methyltransferase [Gammaproteobacteria bacterium]